MDYCDIEWFGLETYKDHSVIFVTVPKYCISDSFVDYECYSISSKGFLPTVIHIMVILSKFTHSGPFSSVIPKAQPKTKLTTTTKKVMVTVWGVCCQSDTLQLSESWQNRDICKYVQPIGEMHQKLQCLQPALVNRKGPNS